MIEKRVVITISGKPMVVNGSGPQLFPVHDELDDMVRAYGRETVLRMLNQAIPRL